MSPCSPLVYGEAGVGGGGCRIEGVAVVVSVVVASDGAACDEAVGADVSL